MPTWTITNTTNVTSTVMNFNGGAEPDYSAVTQANLSITAIGPSDADAFLESIANRSTARFFVDASNYGIYAVSANSHLDILGTELHRLTLTFVSGAGTVNFTDVVELEIYTPPSSEIWLGY